jgi:hypothetical protein
LKLAASLELYAYWEALRGARGAPERNDIEPGAIRGILADTFILQFAPQDGFPFRLVGSRTNALAARELRGATFIELWRPEDRREIARVLAGVADDAQPFLIGARGGADRAAGIDLESVLLPLRHHGATHSRVLGSLAPCANAPWFGILPISPLEITSLRALSTSARNDLSPRASVASGFRRRGHLFVYSSLR